MNNFEIVLGNSIIFRKCKIIFDVSLGFKELKQVYTGFLPLYRQQRQTAVTANFRSKQLLLFALADHINANSSNCLF